MKEMAPDPEELHEMKLNEETYPLTEELFENDALILIIRRLKRRGSVIKTELRMWELSLKDSQAMESGL